MKNLISCAFLSLGLLVIPFCVYGEQQCDSRFSSSTPLTRFVIDKQKGEAFDKKTKLTWKVCTEGQTFNGSRCMSETSDFEWGNAMKQFGDGGTGWRLPSMDELTSIIDYQCTDPTINLAIFPDAPPRYTWVSEKEGLDAVMVDFSTGEVATFSDQSGYYASVRLVRGEKWIDQVRLIQENKAIADAEKQRLSEEKKTRAREKKAQIADEARIAAFRKRLKSGDDTSAGVVVEVKGNLVKIQTNDSQCSQRDYDGNCKNWINTPAEKWFKRSEVYPQ